MAALRKATDGGAVQAEQALLALEAALQGPAARAKGAPDERMVRRLAVKRGAVTHGAAISALATFDREEEQRRTEAFMRNYVPPMAPHLRPLSSLLGL